MCPNFWSSWCLRKSIVDLTNAQHGFLDHETKEQLLSKSGLINSGKKALGTKLIRSIKARKEALVTMFVKGEEREIADDDNIVMIR